MTTKDMWVATGENSGHAIICTTEAACDEYLAGIDQGDAEPVVDGFSLEPILLDHYKLIREQGNAYGPNPIWALQGSQNLRKGRL